MIPFIKALLKKAKERKEHPCATCAGSRCVGNFGPCYRCHNRDQWEPLLPYVDASTEEAKP